MSYRNIKNAVKAAEARNWSHHVELSFRTPGSVPAFPPLDDLSSVTTGDVALTLLSLCERARDNVVFSLSDILVSVCAAQRWYEAGVKSVMLMVSLSIGASPVYGVRSLGHSRRKEESRFHQTRVGRLCYPPNETPPPARSAKSSPIFRHSFPEHRITPSWKRPIYPVRRHPHKIELTRCG